MIDIASERQSFFNSIIGNTTERIIVKLIMFFKTFGRLGLLISKAQVGSYIAIANDSSTLIPKPDSKFPSSKSNCTDLNKCHVISVTWSSGENLSNCWSNGEKLITFTTGNIKGSYHCYIGDLDKIPGWSKTHLTGCIGEIIGFQRILTHEETSYIHQYLMRKWVSPSRNVSYQTRGPCLSINLFSQVRYTTKVILFMSGDFGQLWATLGK